MARQWVHAGTLVLLLALVQGPACMDPIPPDTLTRPGPGALSGTVQDLCSGKALTGVNVIAKLVQTEGYGTTRSTSTDLGGHFALGSLEAGTWLLSLSQVGYQTGEKSVVVASERTSREVLSLTPVPKIVPASVKLDVLFVVDNSDSMEWEQRELARAFPYFMKELSSPGFLLDLHVGVVSTDIGAGTVNSIPGCEVEGDGGKLQAKARSSGCPTPVDPYISLKGTASNVSGNKVNEAFSCIAELGTGGCGFEQPLAVVQRALDGKTNPGFVRDGSVLAVVVLSDEDDCSAVGSTLYDPTQQGLNDPLGPLTSFRCFEFGVTCDINGRTKQGPRTGCKPSSSQMMLDVYKMAAWLKALRPPGKVFFSVIAGPTSKVEVGLDGANPALKPSCSSGTGTAVPAIRLGAVVDHLAPYSSTDSICTQSLGSTLSSLGKTLVQSAILNPCW